MLGKLPKNCYFSANGFGKFYDLYVMNYQALIGTFEVFNKFYPYTIILGCIPDSPCCHRTTQGIESLKGKNEI